MDRRSRRGAVAVSAGIFLGALNMAAVAHADTDSPSPDRSSSARGAERSAGDPGRASASRVGPARTPAGARGAGRSSPVPPAAQAAKRTPARPSATVPTLSAVPTPAPSAAAPQRDSGTPPPSPVAWAAAAAARNEVGRRPSAAAVPVATVPAAGATVAQPVGQYVSPLGTPEQTAAEQTAMRTARSLPVLAAKAVLDVAWRVIGEIEYAQIGGPDEANLAALRDAVDEWAMASAFQSMILNSNEPRIVMQVAPPHRWYGRDVTGSRILYDNPDTVYRFTGVNYASQYVITGRFPDHDPQASFSVLTGTTGTTVAVLDASTLELSPDRTFVLTIGGDPAEPGQTNHLQITPETTLIAIRDTLSDWNIDDPMALSIQRVAGPPPSLFGQFGGFAIPVIGPTVARSECLTALVSLIPPLPVVPPFVQGSLAGLLMLRGVSEESKYIRVATTDPVTGKPKPPNVFTDPTGNASFLATQLQSAGYFQLADDEALVLTIRPNNAGYFVAPVTNAWTITGNYWDRQTSLNHAQAEPNPDGSYTLVVSPTQPDLGEGASVWNWVSTGGLNQGTMAIRFQMIAPEDPLGPTVSSQVVSLGDLAGVLPAGTVLVTPAERAAQLAARRAGFDRRFAPYPQGV